VGYDADLVLVDLEREATVRNEEQITKCGWSPWHGERLVGWPVRTWVMGHEVYREGQFNRERMGREVTFDHALGGYWATAANA
jgi:dihydroorotase